MRRYFGNTSTVFLLLNLSLDCDIQTSTSLPFTVLNPAFRPRYGKKAMESGTQTLFFVLISHKKAATAASLCWDPAVGLSKSAEQTAHFGRNESVTRPIFCRMFYCLSYFSRSFSEFSPRASNFSAPFADAVLDCPG